jgi:hypothetical protein
MSVAAVDPLTGRSVDLENDACKCGSKHAVIDGDLHLHCRSCGRPRGFLTVFTAQWISAVIATVGAESIVIRGPKL